jgi:hypothetical protein
MTFNYKTILAILFSGLSLGLSACNNGPDPAEEMLKEMNRSNPPAAAPAETPTDGAADAAANPCGDAAAENPCTEVPPANPCGEAAAENPCGEVPPANPCGEAAAENPCAADEAAKDETAAENPCADDAAPKDEAAAENPCDGFTLEAPVEEAPVVEEESDVPLDPIDSFMELDPRDILKAKQLDLSERLTSPWDEENPDEFIPETGRVDPLTIVDSAIPDSLKPPRSGSTDENEIILYVQTIQATELVDAVSAMLQCHSVIEIGVVSTAYFTLGSGENVQRFAMQEGRGINVAGANVTCTSISDSKVEVTISVSIPGNTITRNKIYIPRSIG